MKRSTMLIAAVLLAGFPLAARAQFVPVPVPFYNYGGVVAYTPIVDTILSGTSLTVRPTVSADRKYVTMGTNATLSHLIELQNFPVVVGAAGLVGGAVPAGPVVGASMDINASAPVRIQSGTGGSILRRPGMTRVE